MEQSSAGHGVPKIMVFRPTWEEFKDFNKFILHMEAQGAHKAGLAKVIPPPEWKPRRDEYDMDAIGKIKIPAPICQVVTGKQGLYQQINIQKKAMTVREFRELAESERYRTPLHDDYEELERKYWKNVTFVSPIYGADVSGSLTDPDVDEWNINRLGSILDFVNTDYGISIEGVNTAYLYFGMWKTTFAWHTEDMDLYSINFLHFGAPKSWYSIPPEHGRRLERLANGFFSSNYKSCPAYLRHKMTLISPQILKQYSIPYNKITQEAGEIMITFPYGYHAGFNHGFNCAESTNFASPRWVEYGKRAVHCHCRKDMVKISMDTFVKRFQPDRYELWITGKDIGPHPEDPNKLYAASAPSIDDILCNKNNEDIPETYLEAVERRETKRHPIHKKKIFDKDEFEAKLKELVPADEEDDESLPDEETVEVMKDIWIKAEESDDPDFSLDDEFPSKSKKKSKAKMKKKEKPKKKIERKKSTDLFSPKKLPTPAPFSSLFVGERALQVQKVILPSAGTKLLNFRIPKTAHDADTSTPKRNYDDAFESPATTYPLSPLDAPSTSGVMKPGTSSNLRHYQEVNRRNFSNWGQSMRKAISDSLATYNETLKTSPTKDVKIDPNTEAMPSVTPSQLLETAETLAKLKATPALTVTVQSATETAAITSASVVKPIASTDPVKPVETVVGQESSLERQMTWFFPSEEESKNYWSQMNKGRGTPTTSATAEHSKLTQWKAGPVTVESESHQAPILKLEADLGSANQEDACRGPPVLMRHDQERRPREGEAYVEAERRKARKQKSPRSRKLSEVPGSSSSSWAPSLSFLWQWSNVNLRKEADFNFFCSQVEPFCAICALFSEARHLQCDFDSTYWRESDIQMQSHSHVRINEQNFWPRRSNMHRRNEGRNEWDFPSSALLRCSQCRLCVHAKCYGQPEPSHKGAWLCQRCQEKDLQAICSLCLWRGGALKRTTDGKWAHISCALTIPEVTFGDPVRREPINLERLDPGRCQLPCYYCQDLGPQRTIGSGACVRCSTGRCAQSFHPMCGWAAGVKFNDGGMNQTIRTKCTCHRAERHHSSPSHYRIPPPVAVGDTVLAPHPNGGYLYARIVQSKEEEFYWLDFMDGSTSTDTFPEDIVDFDCIRNGPPAVNSLVKVKWTDGLIYDGIYRGSNMKFMYMVRFKDGISSCIERELFYSSREELPKSVRDQMT